jgi:hypothetical protein
VTVSQRALNRAFLERQLLLRREPAPLLPAIEHLVGLQAQAPNPPYTALWTRLAGFDPHALGALLVERQVVRVALMRSTIHLVSAADCRMLRPLVQPVLDRVLQDPVRKVALAGLDLDALVATGRELLADAPLTSGELAALLAGRWPDRDPAALAYVIRCLVPLVQVPPRGVWGRSGASRHTTVDAWLGPPPTPPGPASSTTATGLEELVLRYLAAFGPATVRDVQAWSGLTRLGEIVDRLRPRLMALRGETGAELFDLPDAPRPDPDLPAPVRLLAEFDNVLLGHADRTRVISDADRRRVFTINGQVLGTVLVDGYVHGTWKLVRQRGAATVVVQPFRPLSEADRAAVETEAHGLLDVAAGGDERTIKFDDAPHRA